MNQEAAAILDEVRAGIARGEEPDAGAVEARIRALPDHDRALAQLQRLLAVHRAKRSLAPPSGPPAAKPVPKRSEVYRAKPTIATNMTVRARAVDDGVVLEWDAVRGVGTWEARVAERPDARSPYTDGATIALTEPRLPLRLSELPQRISITGRAATGRIVQRAVVSGLTAENWRQKWLQRASAS